MARLANVTSVAASASAVTLLAQKDYATTRIITNDSTGTLTVKLGAAASQTSLTNKINPGDFWEFPRPTYDGVVTGIWDVANGAARLTEVTG